MSFHSLVFHQLAVQQVLIFLANNEETLNIKIHLKHIVGKWGKG